MLESVVCVCVHVLRETAAMVALREEGFPLFVTLKYQNDRAAEIYGNNKNEGMFKFFSFLTYGAMHWSCSDIDAVKRPLLDGLSCSSTLDTAYIDQPPPNN